MSLDPHVVEPVPVDTVRVAHTAFPTGHPYLTLRDTLGTIFQDADFTALFPAEGQPGLPPWRLALVTLIQFRETLADRQTAEAVRARIDWQYFLGLELTGRVENWRGGRRSRKSLFADGFRHVPVSQSVPSRRFRCPPRRTQHADCPHDALLPAACHGLWDLLCGSIGNSVRPGNAGRRGAKRRYLHETSFVVQRVQNPPGQG